MKYEEFLATKVIETRSHGFEPVLELNANLFDWQRLIVKWAVRQGRCALFEDCGLGKTLQQLEWARHIEDHAKAPVLILCPLAVASQTVLEAVKFGVGAVTKVREADEIGQRGIYICNYERLDNIEAAIPRIAGVILDESSILKSFTGKTRTKLTNLFRDTQYRLACTATPAPNDFMEFGQHSHFLGVMDSNEMLARWFINDTMNFGTYRLKGHARSDFWKWVATWAACVSKPSDLGFDDSGYTLPNLTMQDHVVKVDYTVDAGDGELFRTPDINATSIHKEFRLTCPARVAKAAEIVSSDSSSPWVIWCNTNYEADALLEAIHGAVEVRGGDSSDEKERKLNSFTNQQSRILITKASIAGFGLNWQHCSNVVFVGLSYSFEDFYQALRRSYRFGQKLPVKAHIIQAETEGNVVSTVKRKMAQHEEMREEMKQAALSLRNEHDKQLNMNTEIDSQSGKNWTVYNGDCVRVAQSMPDNSIDYSVYSPPFANLYIYSDDIQDMGNCSNEDEFMEQYRFLIKEKLRITKPGCLSSVHCKNLVMYANRDGAAGMKDFRGMIIMEHEAAGWTYHAETCIWKCPVTEMQRTKAQGLLYKQLRADSRYSRMGMAEYVIHFRKWADGMKDEPVEHTFEEFPVDEWQKIASPVWMDINQTRVLNGQIARDNADEKHICPLQLDVIERCLRLYSKKDALVFSPFTGVGSEGVCSIKFGRRFVGSELKQAYWKLACENIASASAQTVMDLFATA